MNFIDTLSYAIIVLFLYYVFGILIYYAYRWVKKKFTKEPK